MALQKCEECGKEISSKAHSCPHCGYPIKIEDPKIEGEAIKAFLKNEGEKAFSGIHKNIKENIKNINQIEIFIQKHRSGSKFVSLFVGIFFLIKSYTPGWSHYERFGPSYLFGSSFNPFYAIIGLAFIFLTYFIHTKKWPPDDKGNGALE